MPIAECYAEREKVGCPGKALAETGNSIASGRNYRKCGVLLRT